MNSHNPATDDRLKDNLPSRTMEAGITYFSLVFSAGFALGLLVAAEVLLAVALQDRTLGEHVANRDSVSGIVYLAMLALFAVMPLVLARVTSAPHVQAQPIIPPDHAHHAALLATST